MAKWYESIGNGVTGFTKGLTDAFGITDSNAPQRAVDAANSGMSTANNQLYLDMQPQLDQLWNAAADGRSLGQNLNRFDYSMAGAMDDTKTAGQNALGEMDAGNADNVKGYLNPKMDSMLQNTMQTVQGGAGSALQSSATNRNIANSVASQAGKMATPPTTCRLTSSSGRRRTNRPDSRSRSCKRTTTLS